MLDDPTFFAPFVPYFDPETGERQRFSSAIRPAWCRRSPQISEVLPLLYLHGLSTGDFGPALTQFLGSGAGLSPTSITRLTVQWQDEARMFAARDLSQADPHRSGAAWSKSAVRAILRNPRYTGHQVWNKQRKQESLIDVDDVALGHHTRLAWNPKTDWIFSDQPVHDVIITKDTFDQVQARFASRSPRSPRAAVRRTHPYAFKGLMTHDTCGRKMQGNWFHGAAVYRCRYPREYAIGICQTR
jgi:hypothetical protein